MGHAVAMNPMQPVDHMSDGHVCVPSKNCFDGTHVHGVTLADVDVYWLRLFTHFKTIEY